MSVEIAKVRFEDLNSDPAWHDLVREYIGESSYEMLPEPGPNVELYQAIEDAGVLSCFGAYVDGKLIGYQMAMTSVIPHYHDLIMSNESLFVSKDYRSTGAGMALIRAMMAHGKDRGAKAFLATAPLTNGLSKVLEKMGFEPTNTVLCKKL